MMIATIILIIWIVMLLVNGEPMFEWWWLIVAYIVETAIYILGFIGLAILFGR